MKETTKFRDGCLDMSIADSGRNSTATMVVFFWELIYIDHVQFLMIEVTCANIDSCSLSPSCSKTNENMFLLLGHQVEVSRGP